LVLFGEKGGGAKLDFEWKGGRQAGWTRRLNYFTPVENPTLPEPFGLRARKYSGYYNDDLNFGGFEGAPASEKLVAEVNFGDEGSDYSYLISGVFHPPEPGKYTFKTRSDDSSMVMVNGKQVVNNKYLHGMETREGSVTLDKPAEIEIYFGERGGGAGLKFKWKGGSQKAFTDRLGLFTPGGITWNMPSLYGLTWENDALVMTKTKGTSAYDVHAVSEARVRSISGQLGQTNNHVRFGLAPDSNRQVAHYMIGAFPNGRIYIPEAYSAGVVTVSTYTEGSLLEVAVVDGNVVALQDGKTIYNWGQAPAETLYAKISPYEQNAKMTNVKLSIA
jgi:hypothetical protein